MGVNTKFCLPAALALAITATAPALAQLSDIQQQMRTLGAGSVQAVNGASRAAYAELQPTLGQQNLQIQSDLKFGSHELQGFDLVLPERGADEGAPILIYLHGGGLRAGDKITGNEGFFYTNIAAFAADNGWVGVNANYRLTPEVSWPAGAEDLHDLLAWLRANADTHGGDPNKIFLSCNSAGCAHVLTYLFEPDLHFNDGPGVAGAILGSAAVSPANADYYGETPELQQEHSIQNSVAQYRGAQLPLLFTLAEFDEHNIKGPVVELAAQLCQHYQNCPELITLAHHNHTSHTYSINSSDTAVSDIWRDFIQRTLTSREQQP